jgi:hypothetical protein
MNVESSWNVMAHGDAREGNWRGNWRMEWVASTLCITSEHGASITVINTADAHTLTWRPRWFKWIRPFRRKTKSGFCACAITLQTQSTTKVRNLLTSWMPIKFRRKNLLHELPCGVEALAANDGRSISGGNRDFSLHVQTGRDTPSKLMLEVTPYPCLKRPVPETITHLNPMSRLRMHGYDPPFLPCCA